MGTSFSEGTLVLIGCLGVVHLQDCGVLCQKGSLLLLYNSAFLLFGSLFGVLFCFFGPSLLLQYLGLLLPEHLHLPLVLLFSHAAPLRVHLLQTLVLRKLLHQFALEFVLHALFFLRTLGLQPQLVVFRGLEFFANAHTLVSFGLFTSLSCLFTLLPIQLVAKILLEFGFGTTLVLLSFKSLEDLVSHGLSLSLQTGNGISASLLLLRVASDHLVFVLVHLFLAFHKCAFLVHRQNHVSL